MTNVVGEKGTQGFKKHIEFDEDHDHISLMFGTVELSVNSPEDHQKVKNYLTNFISLIGEYFQELYDSTSTSSSARTPGTCGRSTTGGSAGS